MIGDAPRSESGAIDAVECIDDLFGEFRRSVPGFHEQAYLALFAATSHGRGSTRCSRSAVATRASAIEARLSRTSTVTAIASNSMSAITM